MMRKLILLMFYVLTLFSHADELKIDSKPFYKTDQYFQYSLAKESNETLTELHQKKWEENKNSFNNLENFTSPYWSRLVIKNQTSQPKRYYLKSENQFTYHIEFFLYRVMLICFCMYAKAFFATF